MASDYRAECERLKHLLDELANTGSSKLNANDFRAIARLLGAVLKECDGGFELIEIRKLLRACGEEEPHE